MNRVSQHSGRPGGGRAGNRPTNATNANQRDDSDCASHARVCFHATSEVVRCGGAAMRIIALVRVGRVGQVLRSPAAGTARAA
jgi:hypothetical protein